MITNTTVGDEVRAALLADARLPEPAEVAVAVENGTVTLRGTLGSFAQRRAAVHDARKVEGVYQVYDELQVRLLDEARRDDADIRGIALQILMWDIEVPSDRLEVKVEHGWITLDGSVDHQYQSDAAYDDVASLYGVFGITNTIEVITS